MTWTPEEKAAHQAEVVAWLRDALAKVVEQTQYGLHLAALNVLDGTAAAAKMRRAIDHVEQAIAVLAVRPDAYRAAHEANAQHGCSLRYVRPDCLLTFPFHPEHWCCGCTSLAVLAGQATPEFGTPFADSLRKMDEKFGEEST